MNIRANPWITSAVVFAGGVGCGFLAGIFVGNRRSRAEFDHELAELKSHYNAHIKAAVASVRNEYAAVAIANGDEGAAEEAGLPDAATAPSRPADGPDEEPFRLPPPGPVVIRERESEGREAVLPAPESGTVPDDPNQPYVISNDEYFGEELAYQKLPINWYMKDDVLADDHDAPIPDINGTVGADFREHFGKMSGDPLVVFIRNNRIEVDFEVTKDFRSFAEMLGYGNPAAKKRTVRVDRDD